MSELKYIIFNRFTISKNGLKHVNMFNLFSLPFLVDLNNLLPAVIFIVEILPFQFVIHQTLADSLPQLCTILDEYEVVVRFAGEKKKPRGRT